MRNPTQKERIEMATTPRNTQKPADENAEGKSEPIKGKKDYLFSKGDIAEIMGLTTQGFANRSNRDPEFPQPTYSNKSGTVQLYTKEDVKKIHEHLTKADRERIEALNKAFSEVSD
jgi:hypothetical protein